MARPAPRPLLLALCLGRCLAGGVPFRRGERPEELDARVSAAQARMRGDALDAVLLTTEANVRYFTGYHSPFWQSPTRPWFVVVPASGGPIAVVPTIGEDAFARANCAKVVTWPAPRPEDEGVSALEEVLGSIANRSGRIGMELGTHMTVRMPLLDLEELRRRLAARGQEIVDAGPLLLQMRLVKSAAEVAKVEATCRAMSAAYQEVPAIVAEGMTEVEACNAVKRLFLLKGADDAPYVICRSGPGSYSDIIGHPTDRQLRAGDMLIIDSGCQVDGYFCDFNRNFAIGEPSPEVAETYGRLYEATERALAAARPGASFGDLYRAMADSLGVVGEGGVGRMGHSVGLQLTEWPSLVPGEGTLLAEGMVLAVEPSIPIPGGGGSFLVTEEEVLITASGCRLLTERAPRRLPVALSAPAAAIRPEDACRAAG